MGNYLWVGAGLATIGALWNKIQSFGKYIFGMLVQEIVLESGLGDYVVAHLISNQKLSSSYTKSFVLWNLPIKSKDRHLWNAVETFGDKNMFFWVNNKPMLVTRNQINQKNSKDTTVKTYLYFVKKTIDIDAILFQCTQELIILNAKRNFFINYIPPIKNTRSNRESISLVKNFRIVGFNYNDIGYADSSHILDELYYPPHIKNIINDVKKWYHSKEWYYKKKVPWKMGLLLYGPPGSGKTILVRAIAEYLDIPVTVFNLGELSNYEFLEAWQNLQANSSCIALFEDIDNVFHGRQYIATKGFDSMLSMVNQGKGKDSDENEDKTKKTGLAGRLSFDVLLNAIDGIDKSGGILTVFTTNDITKVDVALGGQVSENNQESISSRPGRVDKSVYMGYMDKECKLQMATKFLGEYPEEFESIKQYIETATANETAAQFQERCVRIALKKFWEKS